MSPASLGRRVFAEALGSFLLVATIVGSGMLGDGLSTDDGVALIGNTLATVAMLIVIITALAPVSGAHFNPAVTLVFALNHEIRAVEAAAYAAVQIVAAVLGTIAAHAMFEVPLLQLGLHERSGVGQMLSEGFASFALVFAILSVRRTRPDFTPIAVGLVIAAGYWWTASTSFANPAVTVARALTTSFSGIRPVDVPWFLVGQLTGAVLGLLVVKHGLRLTQPG